MHTFAIGKLLRFCTLFRAARLNKIDVYGGPACSSGYEDQPDAGAMRKRESRFRTSGICIDKIHPVGDRARARFKETILVPVELVFKFYRPAFLCVAFPGFRISK